MFVGEHIYTRTEKNSLIVTIEHPPVNALNQKVMSELNELLNIIKDLDVKVLIITGAGPKAFVAGADISQFTALHSKSGEHLAHTGQNIFNKLERLHIPTIAAINGYALGAGCELTLSCDIRIAEEQAMLGLPEVSLGIIPGYGGTQRLPRLIGIGKAKQLIYSGEPISAQEALDIGLVEKVVPAGEALKNALLLAEQILSRGPLAVSKAKEAINKGIDLTLEEGLKLEASLFGELCDTQDKNEGAIAFIEKRKPNFKGI